MGKAKEIMDWSIYKAVIFDLDGTLIDSMWLWEDLDRHFFADYNIPFDEKYMEYVRGHSAAEVAVFTVKNYPFPLTPGEAIEDWNRRAYEYYSNRVDYKTGGQELLKLLRRNHIKAGIATSNTTELFMTVYNHLNMKEYIDAYITGEMVAKGKPDPECFLKVADMLKASPSECLVFEDVSEGIRGAKAAGMTACAVWDEATRDTWNEKRNLADFYIHDFGEIL